MNRRRSEWFSYLMIIVGSASFGVAIQNIYDPTELVTGGFTGLAIIVKAITGQLMKGGIPLWLTNTVLNIPVFILGYILMGRKFLGRSLFGTLMLSFWLYILPPLDLAQGDYMLAALFGGLFSGAGVGLVLRANGTTGGTDMVAALIHRKLRHYTVAQIMMILDGCIVLTGLFLFGIRSTLYAIVAIFVATKVSDSVLEGFNYSKAAYIITDQYEEIAKRIMEELDRGLTGLSAKGMYTNEDKCVLYCVVSMKEIVVLKELVSEVDRNAFVIVSDVREVLGEGFLEHENQA